MSLLLFILLGAPKVFSCVETILRLFFEDSRTSAISIAFMGMSIMFNTWVISSLAFIYFALNEASSATKCENDKFPCNDGSCIDKDKWCDTAEDCNDDSDELYCRFRSTFISDPNKCGDKFFLCNNGPCIPIVGRCDGYSSCADHSDEKDCGVTEVVPTNESSIFTVEVTTKATELKSRKNQRDIHHLHLKSSPAPNAILESLELKDLPSFSYANRSDDSDLNHIPSNLHLKNASLVKEDLKHVNYHSHVLDVSDVSNTSVHNGSKHLYGESLMVHLNESHHKEDLEKGFSKLNAGDFKKTRSRAAEWLLKTRDESYGWGDETARATTALYMSEVYFRDEMLMSKQMDLTLFAALIRNETKSMALEDLALFINALLASCKDPKNFYGEDLISALRWRTSKIEASSVISPLVYLTLCLNNVTTHMDVAKMRDFVHNTHHISEIGIEAVVSLASTCISRSLRSFHFQIGKQMASKLWHRVDHEGLPENIYDLALVAQALNEAGISQDHWNRSEVMERIVEFQLKNGSFGDILSTYYAMPLLAGKSLLSLDEHCRQKDDKDLVPIEMLRNGKDEKINVSYSLYFGDPPEMTQTLTLKVVQFSRLFDVMRIAETINPVYKFKYAMSGGKTRVYSIGGIVDDAERGLYWSLHMKHNQTANDLEQFGGDFRNVIVKNGQHFTFWLKSRL